MKFQGVLILNWRNGAMRVVRKRAHNISPSEIEINFDIDVEMPEFVPPTMSATVVVPKQKVRNMVLQGEDGE